MTIARVRTIGTISGQTFDQASYTIAAAAGGVAAGHAILLSVTTLNGTNVISATDVAGNTYSVCANLYSSDGLRITILAALNCNALSAGQLITVTQTATAVQHYITAVAEEFSGVLAAPALDATATANSLGSTLTVGPTSPSVGSANELIFTALGAYYSDNSSSPTYAPSAPFSASGGTTNAPSAASTATTTGYLIPSPATGTYSATWNGGPGGYLTGALVTLKGEPTSTYPLGYGPAISDPHVNTLNRL